MENETTSVENEKTQQEELLFIVRHLIRKLNKFKSSERTDRDRLLAIAKTDAEKLEAFIGYHLGLK